MSPAASNEKVLKADRLAEPWSYEEEQRLAEKKLASASACCSPLHQVGAWSGWGTLKQEEERRKQLRARISERQLQNTEEGQQNGDLQQQEVGTTSTDANTNLEDQEEMWDVQVPPNGPVEIVLGNRPPPVTTEKVVPRAMPGDDKDVSPKNTRNRKCLKIAMIVCIILALTVIVIVISTLLAKQKKENENNKASDEPVTARTIFPPDVIDISEGTVLGSFEAEDAVLSNAFVSTNSTGFLGEGYVIYDNKEDSFIEWIVDIPLKGTYALEIRYSAVEASPLDLAVDGSVEESYSMGSTKSLTRWRTELQNVDIKSAGQCSIRLQNQAGTAAPQIDRLTIYQMPFRYQASEATEFVKTELETLYPSFTGEGYASYLENDGHVEWTVSFPESGEYLTSIRYSTTEDRPLNLTVDDTFKVSFSALQTIGWSHWLMERRILSFDKGEHVVRLSASGTQGPNVDFIQFLPMGIVASPESPNDPDQPEGSNDGSGGGGSSPSAPSNPNPGDLPDDSSPNDPPVSSPMGSVPNDSSSTTPSPTASTPEINTFSAILQAEDASELVLAETKTRYDGFSGQGYVDFLGVGGATEWTVDVPFEDSYIVSVKYACAAALARPMDLKVNGVTVQEYSFQRTGDRWSNWSTESHTLLLEAGSNTLELVAVNSGGPNIDFLSIVPSDIPPLDEGAILDVLIVGGGWAGISAADSLYQNGIQNFEIFEARDYVGGRSRTVYDIHPEVATELGSAWIYPGTGVHGIVDNSGVSYAGTTLDYSQDFALFQSGDNWSNGRLSTSYKMTLINDDWMNSFVPYSTSRADDLWWADSDVDYQTVLDEYFAREGLTSESSFERQFINAMVQQELSLEYGAPYEFASTVSIGDSVGGKYSGLLNYLSVQGGGYDKVLNFLSETIETRIRKNHEVKSINYLNDDLIEVAYNDDQGQAQSKYAKKVLVTVPLGVLKARKIQFTPDLPRSKINAIDYIGFGSLNKIVLYWEEDQSSWWPDNRFWNCLITDRDDTSGTWTSYYNERNADTGGRYILTGWIGGKASMEAEADNDQDTLAIVMQNLNDMFGGQVPTPTKYIITRWGQDEHAGGAYSYSPPGPGDEVDRARGQLANPVNNRIFFAGEATDDGWYGTTEGAYRSGRRAATQIRNAL